MYIMHIVCRIYCDLIRQVINKMLSYYLIVYSKTDLVTSRIQSRILLLI